MPIQGFKTGEAVLSPSGAACTVVKVRRSGGVEMVTVRYNHGMSPNRTFRAAALRRLAQ
jgi:hypothetical protein